MSKRIQVSIFWLLSQIFTLFYILYFALNITFLSVLNHIIVYLIYLRVSPIWHRNALNLFTLNIIIIIYLFFFFRLLVFPKFIMFFRSPSTPLFYLLLICICGIYLLLIWLFFNLMALFQPFLLNFNLLLLLNLCILLYHRLGYLLRRHK